MPQVFSLQGRGACSQVVKEFTVRNIALGPSAPIFYTQASEKSYNRLACFKGDDFAEL